MRERRHKGTTSRAPETEVVSEPEKRAGLPGNTHEANLPRVTPTFTARPPLLRRSSAKDGSQVQKQTVLLSDNQQMLKRVVPTAQQLFMRCCLTKDFSSRHQLRV